MEEKVFNCYSPNVAKFLSERGIEPIGEKIHDSGLFMLVTEDNEKGYQRFYNPHKAQEAYPQLPVDIIRDARNAAISSNDTIEILDSKEEVIAKVKRRIHRYQIFEQNEDLSKALIEWKETKPK